MQLHCKGKGYWMYALMSDIKGVSYQITMLRKATTIAHDGSDGNGPSAGH